MKTNRCKSLCVLPLLVLCFILNSCGKDVYFSDVAVFDNDEWSSKDIATFTINIDDITRAYDVNFLVRNSGQYSFANVWFFLTTVEPDNKIVTEKFNCKLAREDGKWLGSHSAGYFDNTIPYKTAHKFEKPGTYTISIEQGMRINPLPAINGVGIQICLSEQ
ncbi:MAG: gliding motility lipoprotein GldH [Bacteroidales bacterium]